MFKNIFPDELNRLVYRNPKKNTKKKEVAGQKPKAKPKPKPKTEHKVEGQKVIEAAAKLSAKRTAEDIIQANRAGGTVPLPKLSPYIVSMKAYRERRRLLKQNIYNLEESAAKNSDLVQAKGWKAAAKELGVHLAEVEAIFLEGAHEAVLLQDADKKGEYDLLPEQHAGALYAFHSIPFHEVMAWYESSTRGGFPLPGKKDLLPGKIRLAKLLPIYMRSMGLKRKKEMVRRILWETVDHFLDYAGGKESLKKRWKEKKDITFQAVMLAEVDPSKVKKPKPKKK